MSEREDHAPRVVVASLTTCKWSTLQLNGLHQFWCYGNSEAATSKPPFCRQIAVPLRRIMLILHLPVPLWVISMEVPYCSHIERVAAGLMCVLTNALVSAVKCGRPMHLRSLGSGSGLDTSRRAIFTMLIGSLARMTVAVMLQLAILVVAPCVRMSG
eukprot:g8823.t1